MKGVGYLSEFQAVITTGNLQGLLLRECLGVEYNFGDLPILDRSPIVVACRVGKREVNFAATWAVNPKFAHSFGAVVRIQALKTHRIDELFVRSSLILVDDSILP